MTPGRWRQWLGGHDASTVVYECRRCGITVEPGTVVCPRCDTDSIARYEIV